MKNLQETALSFNLQNQVANVSNRIDQNYIIFDDLDPSLSNMIQRYAATFPSTPKKRAPTIKLSPSTTAKCTYKKKTYYFKKTIGHTTGKGMKNIYFQEILTKVM